MLKQRIITAAILLPLVMLIIINSNFIKLYSLLMAVGLMAAYEWQKLIPLNPKTFVWQHYFYWFFVVNSMLIPVFVYSNIMNYFILSFWYVTGFMIVKYPQSQKIWGKDLVVALVAVLILHGFFGAIISIVKTDAGRFKLLYLLFLVMAADTGGYFVGKKYGKHLLLPQVSPGKTWEGFFGGLLLMHVVFLLLMVYHQPIGYFKWYLAVWGVWIFALIGDLSISMLKRRVNIKDTGSFLPGHGGILDRIDSLLAAAVVFSWIMV